MEEKKHIRLGVNIIVMRDGKVLLERRNGFGGGSWGLPGGHVEYGESLKECARRELLEETGMSAESFEFAGVADDPANGNHYLQISFFAKGVSGEPRVCEPDECAEWAWFSPDALPEPLFFAHSKILASLQNPPPFLE